jgi:hypothetical protein
MTASKRSHSEPNSSSIKKAPMIMNIEEIENVEHKISEIKNQGDLLLGDDIFGVQGSAAPVVEQQSVTITNHNLVSEKMDEEKEAVEGEGFNTAQKRSSFKYY